eukprot:534568-Rhodomonas_salina.3
MGTSHRHSARLLATPTEYRTSHSTTAPFLCQYRTWRSGCIGPYLGVRGLSRIEGLSGAGCPVAPYVTSVPDIAEHARRHKAPYPRYQYRTCHSTRVRVIHIIAGTAPYAASVPDIA